VVAPSVVLAAYTFAAAPWLLETVPLWWDKLQEILKKCPEDLKATKAAKGLTTPSKYFGSKTAQEVPEAMTKKFGPPKSVREGAETFYNPKTQRSFNVHTDPTHGAPHVDVRRRGGYPERKYPLTEGEP